MSLTKAMIPLLAVTLASDALAEDRRMYIVNRSSSDIKYLYATNTGNDRWGYDRLGQDTVIETGYRLLLNLSDGSGACIFDLKAVLRDGRVVTDYRVNVCTNDTWTVYDK